LIPLLLTKGQLNMKFDMAWQLAGETVPQVTFDCGGNLSV
jgi:hypothetical protein